MASLLVMAFNVNTDTMNVNAIDFGLISKDFNVGSIDIDSLFNCVGAAITCDNDNTVNNNVTINNRTNEQPNVPLTCVECFNEHLTPEQIQLLFELTTQSSLESFCTLLMQGDIGEEGFRELLGNLGLSESEVQALVDCMLEAGVVFA